MIQILFSVESDIYDLAMYLRADYFLFGVVVLAVEFFFILGVLG